MPDLWTTQLEATAFAFRGYNVANLGRSAELLAHAAYGPVVAERLAWASGVAGDVARRPIDLAHRVREGVEPDLAAYDEAVALIVAMELAQLDLLEKFHGVDHRRAGLSFGFSLGELTALACGGALEPEWVLRIPLEMAADCAALAKNVALGVLFSRGPALDLDGVVRLCLEINQAGTGVIGLSTILSPNSVLLMGQGDTLDRFRAGMHHHFPQPLHLRRNTERWPPLHTPIMWQRGIPDRAAQRMLTMPGALTAPKPAVLSLVTGRTTYTDVNIRATLHDWVDHPQRLWDAIQGTMTLGMVHIVHVGPDPNLIPATFKRLADNIGQQVAGRGISKFGLRAFSRLARRQWLTSILPSRAALLRAPLVKQIILEDWLLAQPVN